jgi:hypothetical protein
MDNRISTIYALCDPKTKEIRYIGKTVSQLNIRLSQHITASKKGRKNHLHCWIRSLSEKPIIIPIETVSYEQDGETEKRIIAEYRANGYDLVNESDGGEGQKGYHHTEETKEKIRLWGIGRKMPPKSPETLQRMANAQRGKKHTPEHNAKIALSGIGRITSEETKEKLRIAKLGTHLTPEAKEKLSLAHKGKKLSEEHKNKIGLAGLGRKLTPEQCEARSKARIGKPHPHKGKNKINN